MQPLIAIYDACVLYPNFLRDFLVRLAIHGRGQGFLRGKWTGHIHPLPATAAALASEPI